MLDLQPATTVLARLVAGVSDNQLTAATPCAETRLGDLLDHVDSLSMAFAAAANKTPFGDSGPPPKPDRARLGPDWRARIPQHLEALAAAWRDPAAWEGMTEAGGVELPGQVMGVVALDEVLVHGWDVAVSSGQRFECDPGLLAAAQEFVQSFVAENPEGVPGMFAAPVPVADDAPPLSRLLGLTGRNPAWRGRDAGDLDG